MIRKTTGRVISLVLAAVLAMTSYVPSYAQDVTDPIIDEDLEEPEEEIEEEIEEESEEEKPEVEEPKEENPEVEPEESVQLLTVSEEEPVQLLTASEEEPVTIPIKYSDDISFPDPENQPPTSIVWTGESSMDITVPFPAIPEGYELQSMWAVFKSSNGFINLPDSRNDEDSTYTFTNYYFNMMDLQEGITIGANFTQVYDENDPNAELEIPIRYSLNYKFPADMPKSVKGKIGQTVYFILPYPEVPEGYELNYLRCMASSYGNNALYGRLINNDTAYIYEYVVSKEDVASGIAVFPEFERVIEAVFEDGAHGHHVLAEGDDGKYHLEEFIWGDAVYPGSSVFSKITYVPDHGYTFAGMYYSEEMDDTCILYMPGQDRGTQISEDMLSDDGKLHIYAAWEPLTAEIYLQFGNYGDGGTVTYGEKLPDFSDSSYDSYYVKKDGKKIEIIPGESFFDENIDYICELDRMTGLPKVFYFFVYAEKSKFSTVSFDTGVEGVAIDSQRILNGQTVAKPQVQLEKEGRYLAGWYTDAAFTKPFTFGKTKISGNTTLYAKWVPVEYVVTFHSNIGKDTTAKVTYRLTEAEDDKNQTAVTAGSVFSTLSGKEGFSGWISTDDLEFGNDATGKEITEALVEKYGAPSAKVNLQFYAQWEDTEVYTVILDSNLPADGKAENLGGSRAAVAKANDGAAPYVELVVPVDESFSVTGGEYTLKGFTLSGWEYTDSKGKKVTLKASASPKNLTTAGSEITLKAVWKKVSSYKITYKLNGGTAGKNKTTVTYNANELTRDGVALYNYEKTGDGSYVIKAEDKSPEITRTGYEFAGWVEGSYTYYGDDIYQNLTLTALWTPKTYTLKFMDPDKQTEYFVANTASFDSSFALKDYVPQKGGYTFTGWEGRYNNKVKVFTAKNTLKLKDLDMPEDGVYVLTARFAASSYKVTYSLDGGKIGSKPTSYAYGTGSSKAVPNPKRDGYAFAGWTARVTGTENVVYTAGGEHDISEVINAETGKITSTIYGNIELVANWDPYSYDIGFYRADGTKYEAEDNALSAYLGLNYADDVDFTAAAMFIESQEGFEEGKSVKGFALSATAKSPKYSLYKKYNKLAAKSESGTEIKVYPVLSGKALRVNYSITLMPNAKDVKESESAEGYINNSKGLLYTDSQGNMLTFAYDTAETLNAPEWKREGYELAGFGTSANSKVPVTSLRGLGNGKQTTVKLYAIWKGQVNTITYSSTVLLNNSSQGVSEVTVDSFKGAINQTYKGKDITLKTVSLEGYTFKGWKIAEPESPDYSKIKTNPKAENDLIKKVLKDNRSDLVLEAVFDLNGYKLVFDPNGGTYLGKKQKSPVYQVGYFDDTFDIIEGFYNNTAREGYMLTGLSTAKNGKSRLELYDPNGEEKLISGLSQKNGATVTVYPIWAKVTPAQPSADASLSVSEDGKVSLHMTSSVGVTPENGSLVFEYSTSPLFLFGVKTVRIDSETIDPENVGAVKEMTVDEGLKNKTYYVRIKYGVKDSAGKYSYSKYSKTATAARLK